MERAEDRALQTKPHPLPPNSTKLSESWNDLKKNLSVKMLQATRDNPTYPQLDSYAQLFSPDQHRLIHLWSHDGCNILFQALYIDITHLQRERKPFPEVPQRLLPKASLARTSSHAQPISGKLHSHTFRDLLLNQERDHHLQSHVGNRQMPNCLNKIGVLVARGRKRRFWVGTVPQVKLPN